MIVITRNEVGRGVCKHAKPLISITRNGDLLSNVTSFFQLLEIAGEGVCKHTAALMAVQIVVTSIMKLMLSLKMGNIL